MKDKKSAALLLSLVPIVLGCLLLIPAVAPPQNPSGPFRVKRVVDGDTIVLDDGRHVRYLGINTPERGERFWQKAKDYNVRKVGGKTVTMEFGPVTEDKYGRALAYVSVGRQMINVELLRVGLAHLFVLEPIIYYDYFRRLQEEARARGLGIWGSGGFAGPLKITALHADAQGDDRYNLNGEYVRICNISPQDVDLRGFSLVDHEGHRYSFARGSLKPGYTALLMTGAGKDIAAGADQLSFYWNSPYPIWNNRGDQALLRDPKGKLIDIVEYRKRRSN